MSEQPRCSSESFTRCEVPKQALVSHAIALANEADGDVFEATFPERMVDPWHTFDFARDTHSYTVDILDEDTIVVSGDIDMTYSVKSRSATYNPPGKAHPAEYENIDCSGIFSIELVLEDLGHITNVQLEVWES